MKSWNMKNTLDWESRNIPLIIYLSSTNAELKVLIQNSVFSIHTFAQSNWFGPSNTFVNKLDLKWL